MWEGAEVPRWYVGANVQAKCLPARPHPQSLA